MLESIAKVKKGKIVSEPPMLKTQKENGFLR